jgi:hypothetical protein
MVCTSLMAYNAGIDQDWALNTGRISVAVNNSVDLINLDWCPTCGVCNNYNLLIDSYFMNRTDEASARAMCFCTNDLTDANLIYTINRIAGSKSAGPFVTLLDAMDWVRTNGIFVTNQNYPQIVTSGCVLNMDASLPASYPMVGSSWYNMAVNNVYDGSIISDPGAGPIYNSSGKGSISFESVYPRAVEFATVIPPYNMPLGNEQYTISVWFNPSSLGNKGLVGWGNYGTTNEVNALGLSSTGIVNYWGSNDLSATTVITTGVWCNAVATFNGTKRSIWVNGVSIDSDEPLDHNVPYSFNLKIGFINTTEYFDGLIGDVQIFNRGLSDNEIISNYTAFLTRYDGSNTEICVTPTYCPTPTPTPTPTPIPCVDLVTAVQSCTPGQVNITYTVSRYNPLANGYFDSGGGSNFDTQTITTNIGTSLSVEATPSAGSSFAGWSTTQSIVNPLTTNTTFSHIADYDITYYAVMNKTDVVSISFCYYDVGTTINDVCLDCELTVNVYFDSVSYYSNSIENIIWYSDVNLTTTVPNGLYKINNNNLNAGLSTVYGLTLGDATVVGCCNCEPFTCCD